MSELKATPGPWFVHDNHPQHACYHIGPDDCGPLDVATVYSPGDEEADANAHLIAAAPEMYAQLDYVERLLSAHERGEQLPGDQDAKAWGVMTRAILAKARGEQS